MKFFLHVAYTQFVYRYIVCGVLVPAVRACLLFDTIWHNLWIYLKYAPKNICFVGWLLFLLSFSSSVSFPFGEQCATLYVNWCDTIHIKSNLIISKSFIVYEPLAMMAIRLNRVRWLAVTGVAHFITFYTNRCIFFSIQISIYSIVSKIIESPTACTILMTNVSIVSN